MSYTPQRTHHRLFILAAAVLLSTQFSLGQSSPQTEANAVSGENTLPPMPPVPTEADYEVGPGDTLSIEVYGTTEFAHSMRVSNSGRLHVPYVGVITVAGMTPVEIEREIARLIQEQQLIKKPAVRVHIERYASQPVYIVGEVPAPGQFVITNEMHVLDLIGKAGGLRDQAADQAFLYRRRLARQDVSVNFVFDSSSTEQAEELPPLDPARYSERTDGEVITLSLSGLIEGDQPERNIRLEGGDIVYVPRRIQDRFFVIGDVNVPGAYTLPQGQDLTASQAIVYAGGPLATASHDVFIMRHDDVGQRQSIPIDFMAILDGEEVDVPVLADDIIFVPNSNVRTIGVGLLNLLPRMLQQFLIF